MRVLITLTALTLLTSSVFAQDKPTTTLITRNQIKLNLKDAEVVLAAAQEKATAMKVMMNIAIVDDGGHLITFARMDGARPASVNTALTKAVSAATFRQPTGPIPASGDPNLLLSLSVPAAAA